MRMQDKAKFDRPREKLKLKGSQALSDFELLQALIGSGNKQTDVSQIARKTLRLFQKQGTEVTYDELQGVLGLGDAKISEIMAALEFCKRYLITSEQPIIDSLEKAVEQFSDIRDKKQEYFMSLALDGAGRVIMKRIVSIGSLSASLVHPREVFADVITDRAAGIIVAHNHPSGVLAATSADIETTNRLKNAAEILGVHFIDHIIVTKTGYTTVSEG